MILDYVSKSNSLPFEQQVAQNFTAELQQSLSLQISIVLNGSLQIHYRNHTRQFHTHDIFFFPPFEAYSVINSSDSCRVLTIQIDSDYINHLCPDVSNLTFQQCHLTTDLSNPAYYRVCKDFAVIIFNNLKTEFSSRLKMLSAANDMVITIFDTYGIRMESSVVHDYSTERVRQILTYMNENYKNKLTVTDISSHLGIHPQYFSTFFHKHFHVSFVEYLTTFRINHSLEELLHTDHSILEIALNNGFANHKTYAAAFHKLYGVSPTSYRKQAHSGEEKPNALTSDTPSPDDGAFSYFRQFLKMDNETAPARRSLQHQQSLSFDPAALSHTARSNNQQRFLSVGRASACLRSEVQEQIRLTKRDYNFDYLRFRDIFSDDMYIYYEKEGGETIFSWTSLDAVFDFILSVGLKPFPEIGYMPAHLASKKQYANWQYHPNVSQPKSMEKWKNLIRQFLLHCIDRYGLAEVRTWYFDFWTAPDLKIKVPYWNESQEAFFEFYEATYRTFLEVDNSLRLGSPNFSSIHGFPWYDAFFEFCNEKKIRPSYVAIHLYGCEGVTADDLSRERSNYSVSDQRIVIKHLTKLHEIMDRHGFHFTDVIVSDWNLTYLPSDLIRDTCYMGPYICHTVNQTLFMVKGLSFWSLSDNYEDFFPDSRLFQGLAGLLDFHSFKKASYNTIVLLGMLGNKVLARGDNYLLTQQQKEYQLLLYNMPKFDYMYSVIDQSAMDETHRYNIYNNANSLLFHITIQLPAGTYYIKKFEVNREYGSAYDIWGQIGFPPVLSRDIEDYIRVSSVPHISYSYQKIDRALLLDENVPAHGVTLLRIIPKL